MSDRVNLVALGLADVDLLQTIQNAAFGSHSIALLSKRLEFPLQFLQIADALSHMLDTLIQNLVDSMAILAGCILE